MAVENSNYINILAEIKSVLSGVSNIGKVHDYGRGLKTIEDFLKQFQGGSNIIKGWWIQRTKSSETKLDELGKNQRDHVFVIRGIMSYDDASQSEKTFQNLVESICNSFRGLYNLNDKAFKNEPLQVDVVQERMFGIGEGEMLCHFAELRIEVTELIQNA